MLTSPIQCVQRARDNVIPSGKPAGTRFMTRCRLSIGLLFLLCIFGCSDGGRVEAPPFDPVGIATGAIAAYDTDSDGGLNKKECKKSPFDLARWDLDSDGQIVESEIQERIEKYVEKKTGLLDVICQVTYNRQPISDALVEFVPEDYMGGAIEAAEATTDRDGRATPAIPAVIAKDAVLTGIRPGLYKIKVTHPSVKIPAKFNEETTLSFDASPLDVIFGAVELNLRK